MYRWTFHQILTELLSSSVLLQTVWTNSFRIIIMGSLTTPKLFTPITLGEVLHLPHRVVMAPLTRCRADKNQVPTPVMETYYEQRATSKGLLIAEATSVHENAARYPGTAGIYTEEQIKAWKVITDKVHAKGGKIFLQLWHVGRAIHSKFQEVVSSSATQFENVMNVGYAFHPYGDEVPRELENNEVKEIVQHFIKAGENAIKAGFDGVEVHSANGYLVNQFLDNGVNHRTDEYGGSIDNRCRFVVEILEGLSSKIGGHKVGVRVAPFGTYNGMGDNDRVGLYTHLFKTLSQRCPNLAYVHLCNVPARIMLVEPEVMRELEDKCVQLMKNWVGPFLYNAWDASRELSINTVEEGRADLIAFGRAFISNPDLPLRLKKDLSLAKDDPNHYYVGDGKGYTDYPFYNDDDDIKTRSG